MQELKDKIQKCGLKATPQRIAIYQTMSELGHASADMVNCYLKEKFPSLTVATIYNVLESFVEVGLLVKRFSSNNKMYFDVNTYEHAHMYDINSNSYLDYNDPELIELVNNYIQSKRPMNFDIHNIDIQLIGRTIN